MDAVKFLAEYSRMCNAYNDCVGCPMHDKPFCHPHDMTTNSELKNLVVAVERWSCEHPVVTNGMKVLEMIPAVERSVNNKGYIEICIRKSWWDAEYKEGSDE